MNRQHLQAEVFKATDATLHQTLETLFAAGEQEVEIQHPTEGARVITREAFERLKAQRSRLADANPAERLQLRKQFERQQSLYTGQFVKQMQTAECAVIDLEADRCVDVDGQPVDVEGMTFLHVDNYPEEIQTKAREIGCLVDETLKRPPVRLIQAGE